jgi:tRNA G46 methylase TrmB
LLLKNGGKVHLKTDDLSLFEYSIKTLTAGRFKLKKRIDDVHHKKPISPLLKITTYYEQKWLLQEKPIYYVEFEA